MNIKANLIIRKSTKLEDILIAEHFYKLWLDNNIEPKNIRDDWQQLTVNFIINARKNLFFQAFFALIEERVVGSVSCQLFSGLYPNLFQSDFRNYGYIWNVYVEADFRRQGIANELTKKAISYLNSLDCTHAILHASPYGKLLYEGLGFIPKNEMILDLRADNLPN